MVTLHISLIHTLLQCGDLLTVVYTGVGKVASIGEFPEYMGWGLLER